MSTLSSYHSKPPRLLLAACGAGGHGVDGMETRRKRAKQTGGGATMIMPGSRWPHRAVVRKKGRTLGLATPALQLTSLIITDASFPANYRDAQQRLSFTYVQHIFEHMQMLYLVFKMHTAVYVYDVGDCTICACMHKCTAEGDRELRSALMLTTATTTTTRLSVIEHRISHRL